MQESDVKTLEQAGLTHAQAIIYLTLLELGQTKIGHIIEKTKLQSSVVHNNINKLIEKGLVTFIMVGKIKHYQVAEPEVFLNYMEEQKQRIDENKKQVQKIIPRLKLIKEHTKKKIEVEVYRGYRGFKTAYIEEYERLNRDEDTYFIAMPEPFQQDERLHQMFHQTDLIAKSKNSKIIGLGTEAMRSIWKKQYSKKKYYILKYLKEEFPWDVGIFRDTITIGMWGDEPILIKIKDKRFRDHALRYFNYKWKQAKP